MKYYIAGGAVRDLLLGRSIRDIDAVFDGSGEAFIQRNPSARKISEAPEPVYLLNGIEYTRLREGNPTSDMARRDFTINALALSMEGTLHAHPLAIADLRNRCIRPASPTALADDPVRVFRCARFAALLPDFTVHQDALRQMRGIARENRLPGVAPEQVGREIIKACHAHGPGNFLRVLHAGGSLTPWFAEFSEAHAIPAGPPHRHDSSVLEHTAAVMDKTSKTAMAAQPSENGERPRALAVWMALCHDLGKTATSPEILPRHIGHEKRGEDMARELGLRLRLPKDFIRAGALAARLHMTGGRYPVLRPGSRVDLLATLMAAKLLLPFFHLVEADTGDATIPRMAMEDVRIMLSRSLPPEWRNRGAASGERLRAIRCHALADRK